MKHYGDITKLKGNGLPIVDVVTGGSPCQDLSIAGKRAGLAGERSGLFMEQIRIIKEMRDESVRQLRSRGTDEPIRPRYMVWENVAGAFSSNKGADFQAVLEEIAKVAERDASIPGPPCGKWPTAGCIMGNGWSIAWRLHDAQFWGVPQRRKRIALIADFGGDTAPEILFERKGLSGDSEQSGTQREEVAGDVTKSIGETGQLDEWCAAVNSGARHQQDLIQHDQGIARTLAPGTHASGSHLTKTLVTGEACTQPIVYVESETMYTLNSTEQHAVAGATEDSLGEPSAYTLKIRGGVERDCYGKKAGKGALIQTELSATLGVSQDQTLFCIEGNGSRPSHKGNGGEVSYTLNATEHHAVAYNGSNITCPTNASNPKDGDPCHTLTDDNRNYVVIENHPADSRCKINEDGIVQTLSGRMGTGGNNVPMVMEHGSSWDGSQVAPTLTANNANDAQRMPDKDNFNVVIQCTSDGEVAGTLDASYYKGCGLRQGKERTVVAYGLDRASFNQGKNAQYNFAVDEEKIGTQVAKGPGAVCQSVVRRLTPMECERLQGFPDGWTDIGEWTDSKGKKHKDADSPRYKALGNSIALPFWQWMAEKMVRYISGEPTMASLFDGIGGFPLVYSRCGCKPIWASEIEEFPIAVTKKHFPDM